MKMILTICMVMFSVCFVLFADEGIDEMVTITETESVSQQVSKPLPVKMQPAVYQAPASPVQSTSGGRIIREAILETADPSYVVGSIVQIFPSSLERPTSRIIIADQNGQDINFAVRPLAVIYDTTGTLYSLDQLSSGQMVQVNYITAKDGQLEATSIKISP